MIVHFGNTFRSWVQKLSTNIIALPDNARVSKLCNPSNNLTFIEDIWLLPKSRVCKLFNPLKIFGYNLNLE